MTVHKPQGITVSQAILNISSRDFSPGITYVAVSYEDNAETYILCLENPSALAKPWSGLREFPR
jgi:hypothetical protein